MRVALPWLGYACGVCRYCNTGRETLCLDQLNMGYAIDGGFAEYAIGYARHVVRVPDGVDPLDAAPLTCAGVTTYKAVKVSGATLVEPRRRLRRRRPRPPRRSSTRASPARRSSPSTSTRRGWRRRASSAPSTSSTPAEEDPVAAIQRLGGADAAISTAVTPTAFEQALRLARARRHARLRRPARRERAWRSRSSRPSSAGSTIRGSIVGTRHDLEEVFELHRRGLDAASSTPSARSTTSTPRSSRCSTAARPRPRLVFRMQPAVTSTGRTAARSRAARVNGCVVGVDGSTALTPRSASPRGGAPARRHELHVVSAWRCRPWPTPALSAASGLGDLGAELSTRAGQAIDEALDSVETAGDAAVEQHVLEGHPGQCAAGRGRGRRSARRRLTWPGRILTPCSWAPSATRWRNTPRARR